MFMVSMTLDLLCQADLAIEFAAYAHVSGDKHISYLNEALQILI